MTTAELKVIQPAQWQTRAQLRSNDGYSYEIDREILINSSGFFASLFQFPRPMPDAATVGTDLTNPLEVRGDLDDVKPAAPAQPSTMEEYFDIDIPFDDLKIFADFMQLTDRFKHLVRSANVELDIHQSGVLLPLIDQFDCEFMRGILKVRLASLAKTQPWEVLHLACIHDDVDMARTAISNLTTGAMYTPPADGSNGIDITMWTQLSILTGAWQLEFLRLYITGIRLDPYGSHVGGLNGKFAIWAKDFDPKKY